MGPALYYCGHSRGRGHSHESVLRALFYNADLQCHAVWQGLLILILYYILISIIILVFTIGLRALHSHVPTGSPAWTAGHNLGL